MAVHKLDKKCGEDYYTFAGIVNTECERFKLKELKCFNAYGAGRWQN